MRLMCPNCDAEYSVDDAAIPPAGRDVQCSNCGHAWFQMHPDTEAEVEKMDAPFGAAPATAAPPASPAPAQDPKPVAAGVAVQAAAPKPGAAADTGSADPAPPPVAGPDHPDGDEADEATVVHAQAAAAPAPRTLDENLLAILREEAARETAVRRAEAPAMPEVQPDLGLPEAAHAATPEPSPAADPGPAETGEPDGAEAGRGMSDRIAPRRDLLPDIEEINSTLRAGSEARGAEAEAMALAEKARTRGGFRAGFIVTLIVAVLLTATYTMAPRIAEHLPGSAPMMASYVQGVDVARVWLDDAMQQAAGALRGLTGERP